MANSLLTINMITREAIRLWRNSNAFLMSINRQYDDSFARTGAKIGDALRIRLPNDYTVGEGPAVSVQDTNEINTNLVLATQRNVGMSFSSADRSLSLDDFSQRVLAPAVNNLAGKVALDIMQGATAGASEWSANISGSTLSSPTQGTVLKARAKIANNSAPPGPRKMVLSPDSNANLVTNLSTLYNAAPEISKQYRTGEMGTGLGFTFMEDQTVQNHTLGTLGQNSATVNGAGQTGQTLVVNALAGTLKAGDIITIAGVNGVNRITKADSGQLRSFVVTEDAASGATSISIYPAIIPQAADGSDTQFQTVISSPANGAYVNPISALTGGSTFARNLAFVPEAVTMATADLELPRGVHEAHRDMFDSISMRMVTDYNIGTDQFITRLDILYGFTFIRPEWVVVVPDVVS